MFTGIVQKISTVTRWDGSRLDIELPQAWDEPVQIGESIAINGCCLTAIESNSLAFELSEETLELTTLGQLKPGNLVNVERAMRPIDRFGGHIVQGHIDSTGEITRIEEQKGSWIFGFRLIDGDARLLASKGSICIDGVSLTVVEPTGPEFTVAVIPHTFNNTRFQQSRVGDRVNVEFDILAKHVARLIGCN